MVNVPEEHSTMRDSVYQSLKEDIVSGKLSWGAQLKEAQLAAQYNVSRSPVREALHLLNGDGLVVNYPHRGVFVRQITKEEIDDLIHLRMLLENRGLALSNTNLNEQVRQQLLDIKESMMRAQEENDYDAFAANDLRLHRLIISLCHNKLIDQYYQQLNLQVLMLNVWTLKNPERFRISYAEDMLLIHHLLCGNSHEAVMVNTSHLTKSKEELYSIIERRQAKHERNKKS